MKMAKYKGKQIPKHVKRRIKRANWRMRSTNPKGVTRIVSQEEEESDIHERIHRVDSQRKED
jgi:hypothetical protein